MPGSERETDGSKSHSQEMAELLIRGVWRGQPFYPGASSPLCPPRPGLLIFRAHLVSSGDEAYPTLDSHRLSYLSGLRASAN